MPPKTYAYWEWCSDSGNYRPFAKEESMALEKHYRTVLDAAANSTTPISPSIVLVIAGQSYTFDVKAMTQVNDSTGTSRAITRVAPPRKHTNNNNNASSPSKPTLKDVKGGDSSSATVAVANCSSGGASASSSPSSSPQGGGGGHYAWQWLSHDTFVDYDPLVSLKIENAFLADALVLNIGTIPISAHDTADVKIHFGYMHQINKETQVTRRIRRVFRQGPAPALFSKPPITKPFNDGFEGAATAKPTDASTTAATAATAAAVTPAAATATTTTAAHSSSPIKLGAKRSRDDNNDDGGAAQ